MLIPNLDFGGAQRVFHNHAKELSEKYEVIECVFNLDGGYAFPTGNRLESFGVPAGKSILDKMYRFIQRCWKFYKLSRTENPLIRISHLEGADYVNILSFGTGQKVLVIHGSKVHDQEINKSFGLVRKKLMLPILYKQADLIITVSEGIKQELVHSFKIPPKKITTIYNSFDLEHLNELANEPSGLSWRNDTNILRLITSGRLAPQKNQLSLLYVVELLKEKYRMPVNLFVVGDGPLKYFLKSEADKLSLSYAEFAEIEGDLNADISFLGYQDNPFKFYKEMDIFLFPSAWEGFPMALGEAMALGMPVLSSDCPTGPLELLLPEWKKELPFKAYPKYCPHGVLLPIPAIEKPETIQLWADTIISVKQEKELRRKMGASAQKRMKSLDHHVMKEKWLNIEKLIQ